MKVFFVGNVHSSKLILEKLFYLDVEVVGVATKSKSSFNADHVDLSPICIKNQIPFKFVKDINAAHILDWIQSLSPNIIFVFGWSSLIKKELLAIPLMGVIGFHPAELPMNRGRHPIIWALALGLSKTASTFFFMDEGADSGDILSQEVVLISEEDTAASLYENIMDTALLQVECFVPSLKKGNYKRIKQNNEGKNYWRKRGRLDGQIDFRMSSKAIYNLVRSLSSPYVGAHLLFGKEEVKVWKVKIVEYQKKNIEPGKILKVQNSKVIVKTYDGAIELLEHEFKTMPNVNSYL